MNAPGQAPLRLLAIIDASSITGPAKNLLELALRAPAHNVFATIATFTRGASANQFTETVRAAVGRIDGLAPETVPERGPFDPETLRALRAPAVRVRPDVIRTHAVKSHFLSRWAGFPGGLHGYTWPSVKARIYNRPDRWIRLVSRHRVKNLMIVPNRSAAGGGLLTNDGQDFLPLMERYGYRMLVREPKYLDPVVQEFGLQPSWYHLFEL